MIIFVPYTLYKMKRLITIASVCVAALIAASCKPEQKAQDLPVVTISADKTFSGSTANATLSLSKVSDTDVTVFLASAAKNSKGEKPISADYLTYDSQVLIKAGSTSAGFAITLKAESVAVGAEAAITVAGALNATAGNPDTAYIVYDGSSSGGGSSESGGNTQWSVSYEGYQPVEFEDGTEDSEVIKVSGTGTESFYVFIQRGNWFEEDLENNEALLLAAAEQYLQDDISAYAQYGWGFDDFVVAEDPHYEYYDEFYNGTIEIFAVGMDQNGKNTGKYAWTKIEKTGSSKGDYTGGDTGGDDEEEIPELDVEMQLQDNWSVEIVGEPYEYSNYQLIDVSVNLPGIKYYWLESNTKEELEYYYGSLEGLAASWQADFAESLADGDTIDDILWSSSAPAEYMYYYGAGETTIYVVEFDENGKATGRYGASKVTLPEMADAAQMPKIRLRSSVSTAKPQRCHVRVR